MLEHDVCLIVNPRAGAGRAAERQTRVEAALRARGVRFRVERTTSLEHARELGRGARERGELAATLGGDGLAGAVAGELRDTDCPLAVLPGGRGNDFCRKMGIPQDPVEAVEVLWNGSLRSIDVAVADGAAYLGIASAGIDSDVQDIVNATRLKLGSSVYVYGVLRAVRAWRHASWKVTVDGEEHSFSGYSVAVANSGMFGGGLKYVPEASLDDGLLDIVFVESSPKRHYLASMPKTFKGEHVHDPTFSVRRGRTVTFEAERPFKVYADGDPIADLPCTITVAPQSLRVLAP